MKKHSGFTIVEILVVIAVIAVLASILFPALASAKRHAYEPDEISRLRQVYLGLAMYEEESGEMPSRLGLVRPFTGDDRVFSTAFPVRTHVPSRSYPPSAFVDTISGESPFPIDFGYLKTYPPYDEDRALWRLRREEPLCGVIASPWAGEAYRTLPDGKAKGLWGLNTLAGPAMRGPILRIRMDGSLYRLAKNPHFSGLGDVDGFFYYPLLKSPMPLAP